jgi:hypothetical protein
MEGPIQFGICSVIRFAKTNLYVQQTNIMDNEIWKMQRTPFGEYEVSYVGLYSSTSHFFYERSDGNKNKK